MQRRQLRVGPQRQPADLVGRAHVGEQVERVRVALGPQAALNRARAHQGGDARRVDDERVRGHDAME